MYVVISSLMPLLAGILLCVNSDLLRTSSHSSIKNALSEQQPRVISQHDKRRGQGGRSLIASLLKGKLMVSIPTCGENEEAADKDTTTAALGSHKTGLGWETEQGNAHTFPGSRSSSISVSVLIPHAPSENELPTDSCYVELVCRVSNIRKSLTPGASAYE